MTSRDFCYWLQGYFEINSVTNTLSAEQVQCIRGHLNLVFKHEIDPSAGPPEHQAELDAIHDAIAKVDQKIDAHKAAPHGGSVSPFGPKMRC